MSKADAGPFYNRVGRITMLDIFDILGPVWITSLLSAGLGVTAAVALGRVWKR